MSNLLHRLRGTLVVSCQAAPSTPLAHPDHISAIAQSVVAGGASAIRAEGLANIRAVRASVQVPIIGLIKADRPGTEVYITPAIEDVADIASSGADIVAFDATARPRPVEVLALVEATHRLGRLAMADVSTLEEARSALAAGADIVSTTMAGYTSYSRGGSGPDFGLMEALQQAGIPYAAEGRIWTVDEARKCFDLGASFIVVGSAITRPNVITQRFAEGIATRAEATAQGKAVS